jgi:hypothetical protein
MSKDNRSYRYDGQNNHTKNTLELDKQKVGFSNETKCASDQLVIVNNDDLKNENGTYPRAIMFETKVPRVVSVEIELTDLTCKEFKIQTITSQEDVFGNKLGNQITGSALYPILNLKKVVKCDAEKVIALY